MSNQHKVKQKVDDVGVALDIVTRIALTNMGAVYDAKTIDRIFDEIRSACIDHYGDNHNLLKALDRVEPMMRRAALMIHGEIQARKET